MQSRFPFPQAVRGLAVALAAAGLAWGAQEGKPKERSGPAKLSYDKDIRPIFQAHCFGDRKRHV